MVERIEEGAASPPAERMASNRKRIIAVASAVTVAIGVLAGVAQICGCSIKDVWSKPFQQPPPAVSSPGDVVGQSPTPTATSSASPFPSLAPTQTATRKPDTPNNGGSPQTPPTIARPAPVTKPISAQTWDGVDTGVTVKAGETVVIEAVSGGWNCDDTDPIRYFDAGGDPEYPYNKPNLAVPNGVFCALIAKTSKTGPWETIGRGRDFVADRTGTLYLATNDVPPLRCDPPSEPGGDATSCYTDNHGFVEVRISFP